ncbi:TPA: aminotransferase class I/II-fold pyridoxal phosphate-dependent enzyme [Klebsiella pneumoniae]|uniref:pyridoxal phosphate-dependent aminotransferase n=1 Tax=Enterobacterales TaxID=91347 RepID=UPI0006497928|nr:MULTISPECIES: histidinol-phosphate transaminase [Enterobacterales]HBZ1364700.1 aminotransferase class I/II-fold pyridoxal phosphate-dependent enzyme [Klebsiella pneumoniae]HEM8101496.1 aminotransferase class I/II-fold pyridoxal phosphate-dependent enzyme [Enterobacter hormaechei]KLP83961.1 histidinol phosphate aminotransferase [Enterobacter hormaechei subsp. steigerwaltii]PPC72357.1 histidinol phosphate aminotransferase [Pantoea sp. ICBG 985]HCB0391647.1 aminotransferase class I/II-fold pyr
MMLSKKIRECVEGANNNASTRLHANENPLGSPDLIQTGRYDVSLLSQYPDPTYNALRAAIGVRWNINPEQIITGNGSDELIDITLRSLLKPGARLTAPRHSFMMYKKRTDILGALYSEIPVNSGRILPEDLQEAVSHKPDILVLVNPSNPLGHYIAPSEMISLIETIPPETTIIIDEAYVEFTPDIENTAGIQIVHKRVNSICLRTFSKAYGLAGLRLGWAYVSADLYPQLEARRAPYNVSALSALAGEHALQDREHLFKTTEYCLSWGRKLVGLFEDYGVKASAQYVNFVFVEFDSEERSREFQNSLNSEGFLIARLTDYSLDHCLRISFGPREQMEKLFSVLEKELKA